MKRITNPKRPPSDAPRATIREWLKKNWQNRWWGVISSPGEPTLVMDCDRCRARTASHPCDDCKRWDGLIRDFRVKSLGRTSALLLACIIARNGYDMQVYDTNRTLLLSMRNGVVEFTQPDRRDEAVRCVVNLMQLSLPTELRLPLPKIMEEER